MQSATRNIAFLSVKPDPLSTISGLIADIGDLGWAVLDEREAAYDRQILTVEGFDGITMYQAKPSSMAPLGSGQPILLSYLDCVVQGFNTVYGEDGVRDFFRSTTGWDTPILNDRAAPIYPRAQVLSDAETKLTDDHIKMVGAHVIARA